MYGPGRRIWPKAPLYQIGRNRAIRSTPLCYANRAGLSNGLGDTVKPHKVWLLVALLWVVALLNYLDRQVIYSVFPLLKADLRLSDVQLGLLSTVFLWVYGLLSPVSGFLADRFGRVRITIGSLLVWSLVTWLTGRARDFNELAATRALIGLSEACYLPAALALIADYYPQGRLSLATGIHTSGIYVSREEEEAIGSRFLQSLSDEDQTPRVP